MVREQDAGLAVAAGDLGARLAVPRGACGVVVFAHGAGSSRNSPRNRAVATALNDAGFATLLLDLLTPNEAVDRTNVFDIELLSDRLRLATGWLSEQSDCGALPVGYFGASTGAAAALWAAAHAGDVSAIVCRGGRPDLAFPQLEKVRTPTLFIVGERDPQVLALNREARAQLHCDTELSVVPGATHLFEEPGALERVAELAIEWFARYLQGRTDRGDGSLTEPRPRRG
jgi:putative phosphoribosyl transferase